MTDEQRIARVKIALQASRIREDAAYELAMNARTADEVDAAADAMTRAADCTHAALKQAINGNSKA